jgi:archaeosine synthase
MNNKNHKSTYKKVSIKIGTNVIINPSLCLYNPSEVKDALLNNQNITKWLKFISNHYIPEKKDILLIYPCSTTKPYNLSKSYQILLKNLNIIDPKREKIHLMTISEPFGLVPEEFYGVNTKWHNWENDWYDCPGLFEWWCNKYNFHYDREKADEAIEILSSYVGDFLIKVDKFKLYKKKIALVRTFTSNLERKKDHTHRRILEKVIEKTGTEIEIIPTKEMVNSIVKERGSFAWDMWGVAHPMVQDFLFQKLKKLIYE